MPVNIRWPGHQRELDQTELCSFARFDFRGATEVSVEAYCDFSEVAVRPRSRGVAVRRDGHTVRFSVTESGAYSVEFDGIHGNFMLFADPPKDFSAIDKSSPSVRYFGPGEHDAGLIVLKSGETLFIDEGAVVYGRVYARDADGVRICGRGILDMSRIAGDPIDIPAELAEEQRRKGWAITNIERYDAMRFEFCDDLSIEGVTIRDSLVYAIHPICCRRLSVDGVKILGSWRYNSDGIDMHNCRGVHVSDCFVRTYDDSICIKGFDYLLPESEMVHDGEVHDVFEDVLVERCVIWNDWGRALEIGAETRAREIRGIVFRDCDILACESVVADVQNCDQAIVRDVVFEDIRIDYPADLPQTKYAEHASDFDASARGAPAAALGAVIHYIPEYSKAGAENRGRISGIVFRNVSVAGIDGVPPGFLRGFGADHRVDGVRIEGVSLDGRDITTRFAESVSLNEFADAPVAVVSSVPSAPQAPFVMMRMTLAPLRMPEKMREVIAVNAAHPGSCDSYWFANCAGPRIETCRRDFAAWTQFRGDCENAGISVDFQQGVTLGHGSIFDLAGGGPPEDLHPFTDGAWQRDCDGNILRMFCPRSPEVLEYEEKWVASLCGILKPGTIWLDDDLRMGYSKTDGCFCDRCIGAFNEEFGHAFTRAELKERLFGQAPRDPVRREWLHFLEESLAMYGAAARRGADSVDPACVLAYQSVDSSTLRTGHDAIPLLKALSGGGTRRTAIRVGSGCYNENATEIAFKALAVSREAERCRASSVPLMQVCYEQETYMREITHKSSEAALVESAVALAAGCDSLSEYRWDGVRDEPLEDYREFASLVAAWRPYLERVASFSRSTSLGGIARFVGGACDLTTRYDISDPTDMEFAALGVAVTTAEAGRGLFYVDARSIEEWADGDGARLFAAGNSVVVDSAVYDRLRGLCAADVDAAESAGRLARFDFGVVMRHGDSIRQVTTSERAALLDAIDSVGGAPVRIGRSHRFFVYPRVDADGGTVAVTLYNASAGKSFATEVTIRNPAGAYPVWARPCEAEIPLYVVRRDPGEITVVIPELPGRQIGTIILCGGCPETASETARVAGESAVLPRFDPNACGWMAGYRPRVVRMWEVSARDCLLPETMSVVAADGRVLRRGEDWEVNPEYGTVGLVGAAAGDPGVNPVTLAYSYRLERLDAWFVDSDGAIGCRRGIAAAFNPTPPPLPAGTRLLGHFWVRGAGRPDNGRFFRNEGRFVPPPVAVKALEAMPVTLGKLRRGEPVKVLAWGDSVTECTYMHKSAHWQTRVADMLRARYPRSEITLVSRGWGGRNTCSFLDEPSGSAYNFAERVVAEKPDLVICEFVNDCGLPVNVAERAYGRVLAEFRANGIEWVILTPHYVTPQWMGMQGCADCDDDPRECVRFVREFAVRNRIGLADASLRWGHIWREGMPYQVRFVNGVNHPDEEGMGLFVDAFRDFLDTAGRP